MNIEDKAPLTGNYNRTDLRLVVVDMAQSPTPDGNQARTIAAADLFAQLEQGREVIPFEALTSLNWNVAAQPRVYLDLVADLAHITTKNAANGFYFELHARQPQGGGKKLTIDGVPVMISGTGNTLVIARYIGGVLDVHTDASAEAGKPVLLDESVSQTVLEGEYAEVWARFSGADEYVIERDGKPVPEATGAALLIKVAEPTAGAYEVIARNDYGETRSAAKFIKPGEAESVYLVTEPADTSVPAGTGFTLTAAFAGTPPPAIKCVEITNGQPTQTVSHTGTYQGTSLYTRQYQFIATNSYKVPVEVKPAEFAADGVTIINPAVTELQKKTFTAVSKVITVTPIKQEQAAPNKIVFYDDGSDTITLGDLHPGKSYTDLRIIIDDAQPITPTGKTVSVGDKDIAIGAIKVYYVETEIYRQSAFTVGTVAFNKIPLLQNITLEKGTPDNLKPIGAFGDDLITWKQGAELRNGVYWTNSFVLDKKKAEFNTNVYIQFTVKIGLGDVRLGYKLSATTGGYDTQEACILMSSNGQIGAEWKKGGQSGYDFITYGNLLNDDIYRLYHNDDGTYSASFIRNGSETYLPVGNPSPLPIVSKADLFVHMAGRENADSAIYNPQTFNLKSV